MAKLTTGFELPLVNGEHVIRWFDPEQVYDIREKDLFETRWTWKPFFRKKVNLGRVTEFKIKNGTNISGNYVRSNSDPTYIIRSSLDSFCRMVGIKFQSCSESILRDAIKYG